MEKWVKILEKPDGSRRVVICLRDDGIYTYRCQWATTSLTINPGDKWGQLGPGCGLYNSCETAETEAMQRIDWLKAGFH